MRRTVKDRLAELMNGVLAQGPLQALFLLLGALATREASSLGPNDTALVMERVKLALRVYNVERTLAESVRLRVAGALSGASFGSGPAGADAKDSSDAARSEAKISVRSFDDAVQARMLAKDMASRLGFSEPATVRIATSVSELARNIVFYAGSGLVLLQTLRPPRTPKVGLRIIASDSGPGIENLDNVLAGRHKSTRGLGLGLKGVRQLMDDFDVRTGVGKGTVVTVAKYL
ncbi:MAG TPA: anti-sigma regulatory factor [Myxococcales bacterium]|jgi:serine/threonine-protein kinase RsbT